MNEEKTPWMWGEGVKQRLDRLYKTAKNADSAVQSYLRSMVTCLLQVKTESAKRDNIGDLLDILLGTPVILKPESKAAALLAKGVGDSRKRKAIKIAQIDKEVEEVINSIPLMNIGQLRKLARFLMSDKSISDIKACLNRRFYT